MLTDVFAMVTAMSTATATIIAVVNIVTKNIKDNEVEKSKSDKIIEEICTFAKWYRDYERDAVAILYRLDYEMNVTTEQVYSLYRQKMIPFNGNLKYWRSDKVGIKKSLRKNFSEDCEKRCEDFVEDAILLIDLLEHVVENMKENSSSTYNDFKKNFYNNCPDGVVRQYGTSFTDCLIARIRRIEHNYTELARLLNLEITDISGTEA